MENYYSYPFFLNSDQYKIKLIDTTDDNVYGISEYFKINMSSIPGYNPILPLSVMSAISVIIIEKRRKKI